jgi:hypothetical protein
MHILIIDIPLVIFVIFVIYHNWKNPGGGCYGGDV